MIIDETFYSKQNEYTPKAIMYMCDKRHMLGFN